MTQIDELLILTTTQIILELINYIYFVILFLSIQLLKSFEQFRRLIKYLLSFFRITFSIIYS